MTRILAVLTLLAPALPASASQPLAAGAAYEAALAADPAAAAARADAAAKLVPVVDGARLSALVDGMILTQLPAGPGEGRGRQGGALPPGPGEGRGGALPPGPGEGGALPPGPGESPLPKPIYPGGPLPRGDHRLENAPWTNSEEGEYLGYWNGSRGFSEARGRVETTPSDRSGRYILVLKSEETQDRTHFVRKSDGKVYHYSRSRHLGTETRRIVVDFVNRAQKPLLPWERETFVFSFKGDRRNHGGVALESSSPSYRYVMGFRSDPADQLSIVVEMEGREKLRTAPDYNGVSMSLEPDGSGGLKLVVIDHHASYYEGESLQIAYSIKKDVAWRIDPEVAAEPQRSPRTLTIPAGSTGAARLEIPVTGLQRGEPYYLSHWSFQRLNSSISTMGFVNKPGNDRHVVRP